MLPSGKFKAEAWATCQVKIKEVKHLHSHCRVHACFRERTMIQTDQMIVKHTFLFFFGLIVFITVIKIAI